MPQFHFKACVKCGGDLAMDDGDWICLQCGTYYYVGLYQKPAEPHRGEVEGRSDQEGAERANSALENRREVTLHEVTLSIVFASVLTAGCSVVK